MSLQKIMLQDKKYSPEAIELACLFLDTLQTTYDVIVEIIKAEKVNLCYIIDKKPVKIAVVITFYPYKNIEVIDYISNKIYYFQKQSESFYMHVFELLSLYDLKQI